MDMTSPPKTSLTDVVAIFAFSLFMTAILHLTRGQKVRLAQEIAMVRNRYSLPDSGHPKSAEDEMLTVRKYHNSLTALILSWLPFLILVAGDTCCSLLRDAGYLIFPWPLLAVSLLFGLGLWATQTIRLRSIRRLLLRAPNKPLQPNTPQSTG